MPAKQRGSMVQRGKTWQARWYDENGNRHARGGFKTKTDGWDWLTPRVDKVKALRQGDIPTPDKIPTVNELVENYLATHDVDPATTYKLRSQLRHATSAFGDRKIDDLTPLDLSTWRATLPARTRHQPFGAFKAVLEQAVTLALLQTNPAGRIKNRQSRLDESREILPFTDWDQVEMVAEELNPLYAPIPIILVGAGLRPEEAFGAEWRDVDLKEGVLNIERVYTKGLLKPCKKSDRQRRQVPLRARVIEALERMPRGFGQTPVLLSRSGGRVELETFRNRHWNPALAALKDAGIDHRGVYACRHTFATWSIRAGVDLFHLSRVMGTSLRMIDKTYGHLAPDAHAYIRGKLDSYDSDKAEEATGKSTLASVPE